MKHFISYTCLHGRPVIFEFSLLLTTSLRFLYKAPPRRFELCNAKTELCWTRTNNNKTWSMSTYTHCKTYPYSHKPAQQNTHNLIHIWNPINSKAINSNEENWSNTININSSCFRTNLIRQIELQIKRYFNILIIFEVGNIENILAPIIYITAITIVFPDLILLIYFTF